MSTGFDGGLYRAAQLLLEAIQCGAKSPTEKRYLYKALEALGQAEIEGLEEMSDRNFKSGENS